MNALKLAIGCALLLAATLVNAKPEKMLVCHIGNETGPGGETYLDDPNCVPSDLNNYFCPNAGKIDLIVVPERAAANHLENPNHYWDGISDYDPIAMGASGDGTEDSDGNGVDGGCEIPDVCPCWAESELQAVTAENQDPIGSCSAAAYAWPSLASLASFVPIEVFFYAQSLPTITHYSCGTEIEFTEITPEEAQVCIAQIAQRCVDIGDPIVQPN